MTASVQASAAKTAPYKKDQFTLKWTVAKDLGLLFVVNIFNMLFASPGLTLWQAVYQSLVHIAWIDKLLDNIRTIFVELYADRLKKPHVSSIECGLFDRYFDQQLRQLEGVVAQPAYLSEKRAQEVQQQKSEKAEVDDAPPPVPGLLKGKKSANIVFCN